MHLTEQYNQLLHLFSNMNEISYFWPNKVNYLQK